jgi:hypothetical protein
MSTKSWFVVGALVVLVALVWFGIRQLDGPQNGGGPPGEGPPEPHVVLPPGTAPDPSRDPVPADQSAELTELRATAYDLQKQRKWCESQEAWEKLLAQLPAEDPLRAEAQYQLELLAPLCDATRPDSPRPPVSQLEFEDDDLPPEDQRPEKPPEDQVAEFYKVGRTVRSLSLWNITGKGTNVRWALKKSRNFAYQYKVVVETKVVENTGGHVIFEQRFAEVAQLLAHSNEKIELSLPDSPILTQVWKAIEDNVLDMYPQYRVVKRLKEIIDPDLEHTLTFFNDQLKRFGVELDDHDEVEYIARIDELAGLRLRITYVPGLGVNFIEVLDGKQFDPDGLDRIAYNSSLFMDYFVSKAAGAAVGSDQELRSEDVGGMVAMPYDVQMSGVIKVRRREDEPRHGESMQVLDIVGGTLAVTGKDDGIEHEGDLKPVARTGTVYYAPKKLLVREARATWEANTSWVSTDHLLFKTQGVQNVKMQTYYEADLVPAGQ